MLLSLRSRIGLRAAQLGGLLMMLGGLADLTIRELLPGHREFLGFAHGQVPPATEALLLALLHALGAALVASGLAVLVLLHHARTTGHRLPVIAAAGVAILAEGMNAVGMYRTGSLLFLAPLAFLLLVVVGVALCALPRWELGTGTASLSMENPSA